MSSRDRVILPVAGLGVLVLELETYQAALAAGAELVAGAPAAPGVAGAPIEPLLDADQAAAALGVTPRLIEDLARAQLIPHHRIGERAVRFKVSEIQAHSLVAGAASPTDSHSDALAKPLRRKGRNSVLSNFHPPRSGLTS
jgi:excisionase family DNA binding protein